MNATAFFLAETSLDGADYAKALVGGVIILLVLVVIVFVIALLIGWLMLPRTLERQHTELLNELRASREERLMELRATRHELAAMRREQAPAAPPVLDDDPRLVVSTAPDGDVLPP